MHTMKLSIRNQRVSLMSDLMLKHVTVTLTGQKEFGEFFYVVNERFSLFCIT